MKKNYSADWLPNYDELRAELIAAWRLMERRRKEDGKSQKGGHPTLPILTGHEQPGPHQHICYGCGKTGHMRGDKTCAAGPNGVWDGAPQVWKDRVKKGLSKEGGKVTGKGRGGASKGPQESAMMGEVVQREKNLATTGFEGMASANIVSLTKGPKGAGQKCS